MTVKAAIPNLGFSRMPTSKTSIPWDIGLYVYQGAAGAGRRKVRALIAKGEFGAPDMNRLPVLIALHEVIEAELERGVSCHTINANLRRISSFISWADARSAVLDMQSLRELYLAWCGHMVHRYKVVKDISHASAYSCVAGPAKIIGLALGFIGGEPGRTILKHSTMVAPRRRRKVVGAKAAKRKMEDLYAFGHALLDLCTGLSIGMVCRRMPIHLPLRSGKVMTIKGSRYAKKRCKKKHMIKERRSIINLRIEAELLIFITQTGMNLSQAESLQQFQFRYQTNGDELNVFRSYKGRRGGEVIFRCFREYRGHLNNYLAWLDKLDMCGEDKRMFPFLRRSEPISGWGFRATKQLFEASGVPHIMPRELRKARVNWLLRRSRDPGLTAEQVAHTKETLLRDYEEPHHQSASVELARFHRATDPTLEAPGSGKCVREQSGPCMVENAPGNAPEPDCISPEGCLFCVHQRDVVSADYCWKLASHAQLKKLELVKYRPPKGEKEHPAQAVIDRIGMKLNAIAKGSKVRCQWVRDALDSVRAGIFHPLWDGHIKLAEVL